MDYMTLKETAEKWNVTPRQVNYLCSAGRIPGAVKMASVWLVPKNADKPVDGRTKQGKELKNAEDRMWDGNGNFVDDNTLSVYIRRLRNKIEDTPNQPKFLLTERGIGYKWVVV